MFELDDAQRTFEAAVRAWCTAKLAPAVPQLEAGARLPYDLLRALGRDLGVADALAALAGERVEGASAPALGDDPLLTSVLLKELSRVSPGFALVLLATVGCATTILAGAPAEVIARHGVPLLRFETIGAWALTEPEAGSDAFGGMRTTALLDGGDLVLTGHKTFITNAPHADVFAVWARVRLPEGEPVVRAIVVERDTPGLATGPAMRKMGVHDAPTGELFLDGCRVPRANLVGSLERGARRGGAALPILNLERAVMPAICLGIIERSVEESARYAATRRQFGRPLVEFQAIAFKLARMELALENARNLVHKLAWATRAGRLDARLASIAKLYCAEKAVRVSLDAVQIHGGSGYMTDLPLEKLARDAKFFEIGGGTNELQLQTIARAMHARHA